MYFFELFFLVILLPMLPASLLFWGLPSTGQVQGKLQGLEIKLGGAFAGYFALVLLILYNHVVMIPPPPPPPAQFVAWTVRGKLTDPQGHPLEPIGPSDVEIAPPIVRRDGGGEFVLHYFVALDPSGNYDYPTLHLSHKEPTTDYEPISVRLNPNDHYGHSPLNITQTKTEIELPSVTLHPIADTYNSSAPALNSVLVIPAHGGHYAEHRP